MEFSGQGPEFGGKQAVQKAAALAQGESRSAKGGGVIGQTADGESGEQAESTIQQPDHRPRHISAERAYRDCEFRYHPTAGGRKCAAQFFSESLHIFIGEAIEEEMRCNQVAGRLFRLPHARIGAMDVDAFGVGFCAAEERAKHRRADIDRDNFDGRIHAQQLRGEAAIAIAKNGGVTAIRQVAEKCVTATLQPRAEREELHPAVEMRKPIELGGSAL